MLIWGRLIGAGIGLLWGIPGVLLGFALGYFFDQGLKKNLFIGEALVRVEQVFFSTTFAVMGHIAKADGRVNEAEISAVQAIMTAMALSSTKRQEAIDHFKRGKLHNFNLDLALDDLLQVSNRHPAILRYFLELQTRIALADGQIRTPQRRILQHIAQVFNFDHFDFEQFWQQEKASYQFHQKGPDVDDMTAAYQVLGVSRQASDKEIKVAYRRLMSQHHPDKLAAKGLPKEMLQVAHEKTQEITLAYERIKKHRQNRSH